MKNRILWIPLLGILAIMNLIGCSKEKELPPTVTLEADKTNIKANGRDSLTFTVKVNGKETTQGVTVRSDAGATASPTLRYAASEVGTHTFYAIYEGTRSNTLAVTVSRIVITLLGRMEREQTAKGLATMCIGVGQGAALLVERV